MKRSFGMIYEVMLATLVILSLTIDLPSMEMAALDWTIWSILVIDYTVRLLRSENKWKFIRENPLELIAILPLDQLFRSLRFVRLFKLFRLILVVNRRFSFLDQLLQKFKVDSLILGVVALLFFAALPMKFIEPRFDSYADALWWAVVTMTTVGYGDLYPETTAGRIIASVLMFSGIGIIGIVTGTVASIFTDRTKDRLPKELRDVQRKLDEYPELDEADYDYMIQKLGKMKSKDASIPKDNGL